MYNKKGFTLVELLAVILLIAVIASITVVSVNSIISKNENTLSKTQKKNIERAAETYYTREGINNNLSCISLSELVESGYIDKEEVKDPKTNQVLNGYIKITNEANQYNYSYQEESCNLTYVQALNEVLEDNKNIVNGSYYILNNSNLCIGTYKDNTCSGTQLAVLDTLEKPTSGRVDIINNKTVYYDIELNGEYVSMYEYTDEDCFEFDENTNTLTDYYCYEGNTNNMPTITDVVIPKTINGNDILVIGGTVSSEYIFYNKKITSVIIPDSVVEIKLYAFTSNNLKSLIIPNSVLTIGQSSFSNNKLNNIVLSTNITSMGGAVFNNNNLPDSQAFLYKRNNDGSIDYTTIIGYGGSNKQPIIPEGVKILSLNSLSSNSLTKVTLPNTLTQIQAMAFNKNNLTEIEIPNSVTTIGNMAFSNNKLTEIIIPEGVKSIGDNIFSGNSTLTKIYYKGSIGGFPWGATNAELVTDF